MKLRPFDNHVHYVVGDERTGIDLRGADAGRCFELARPLFSTLHVLYGGRGSLRAASFRFSPSRIIATFDEGQAKPAAYRVEDERARERLVSEGQPVWAHLRVDLEQRRVGVEIRPAAQGDAEAILHVLRANANSLSLFQRTRAHIARSIDGFVVAVHGGRVIGCSALLRYDQFIGEISSVAVMPEFQRLGVASRLVEDRIRRADDERVSTLFVLSEHRDFFFRFGFTPVSRTSLLLRNPRVLMRKLLETSNHFRQRPARWIPALFTRKACLARRRSA